MIWVFYNGYEERLFSVAPVRSPYRLFYGSHPSKGLDTAIDITQRLRAADDRYHLVVCGGEALWGRPVVEAKPLPGVEDLGLLPQKELAETLLSSTFSLALQSRLEPFGMLVTESQRAGCVVLASPVGAYSELVQDGVNGLMIEGDHELEATRQKAVEAILGLAAEPGRLQAIQQRARRVPWSTDLMAQAWIQHWELLLEGVEPTKEVCLYCGGEGWRLEDGVHCLGCRKYTFVQAGS
jgi:glycosyltransferase involved in cell wall biosynthesis